MSTNACPEYPDELKLSNWEKDKKSGFDAKSDLADKMKSLQKKHDSVNWKLFADGWTRAASTAAELETEVSRRDELYGGSVLPLKKEVQAVVSLARSAEKAADKSLLVTLKAIAKAADAYVSAIDQGALALKDAGRKARDAMPDEEDEDSAPSALLNPKLLLKQLTACRKDPERRMQFAFVDADGKQQPALLAMHPRMSARSLFGKLQAAAGVKSGAYGSAWVDGTSLMLQLDKPMSGLVKKLRPPVKDCGFRISKIVLYAEDGQLFEQDEQPESETGSGAAEQPGSVIPTPPQQPSQTYEAKLAALTPSVRKAVEDGHVDAAKQQALLNFAIGKAADKDYPGALAALNRLDQLLGQPSSKSGAAGADLAGAFKSRMMALIPRLKQAEAAGHAQAPAAKRKASEAGLLAGKRDFEGAAALLDDVEGLLAIPSDGATDAGTRAANEAPAFDEAAFRHAWQQARGAWIEAIETVDAQIAKLQAVLREQADEDLAAIAEFGLPALTGDFKAPMMAAVIDVDRAAREGLPRLARRARSLAQSFAEYLDEAETVAVTDDNDFGVTVTIRKTIGGALRQLEQTLAQAAG